MVSRMRATCVPIDDPQWCELASSHPDATPFHLPGWANAIAECYGFTATALVVSDESGALVAGIPVVAVRSLTGGTRWVSLPYSDLCAPLVREGSAIEPVVACLARHARDSGVRDLEIRTGLPPAEGVHAVDVGYTYDLPLPSDAADLHPSSGHRRNRNRAARQGISVIRGDTADDVATYYRLHTLTRRRQGVPVQPRRFFDLIGEHLVSRGHGFVATAVLDGEPLAANLYLAHGGTLVAKYRASDPAHQDTGAGFLVDWEIMSQACSEGYRTLDLGRTDFGEEGQRRYKSGWGAIERTLTYTHVSDRAPADPRLHGGGLASAVIRRSPLWVCRAAGEILYRFTA